MRYSVYTATDCDPSAYVKNVSEDELVLFIKETVSAYLQQGMYELQTIIIFPQDAREGEDK